MFWPLVLSLGGPLVMVNVFLAYWPPYQRYFQRQESRQRALTREAEQRAAEALHEALLEIATLARLAELPPLEKPCGRIPPLPRVQP
jgi:hypothetical protein